jgi:hypothetical protein
MPNGGGPGKLEAAEVESGIVVVVLPLLPADAAGLKCSKQFNTGD